MADKPKPTKPHVAVTWEGQTVAAAEVAQHLTLAAMDLFDIAAGTDPADMWEEARRVASHILFLCPADPTIWS